jgi:hypothetical protein
VLINEVNIAREFCLTLCSRILLAFFAGGMERTRAKKAGPDALYDKPLPIKGKAEVMVLCPTAACL